jgi:hypothetical protein
MVDAESDEEARELAIEQAGSGWFQLLDKKIEVEISEVKEID